MTTTTRLDPSNVLLTSVTIAVLRLTDPFYVFENKCLIFLWIVFNWSTGMFGAVCPQMPTTEPWAVYMYFHVTDQDVGSSSTLIVQSFTTSTRIQWNRDGCRAVTFRQNTVKNAATLWPVYMDSIYAFQSSKFNFQISCVEHANVVILLQF